MKYGDKPKNLGVHKVKCDEMMFYQYLPIKLNKSKLLKIEERLIPFVGLISSIIDKFIDEFGEKEYVDSYVYLTVKNKYQTNGCSFNRKGYHSDGFLTDDINYVWCDNNPTTFNFGKFDLSLNDEDSLLEMEQQADKNHEFKYPKNTLLRLNEYSIHKVTDEGFQGMRCFVKASFSKDRYDLLGNSKNYLLDYNWEMKPRGFNRNIPQSNLI